ncbi:MAG: DUF1330 domain-containing protein [Candidatus Puniceispirillum sp.]|jgi:uncharacterized protein (DUF1330 family)
MAKAYWITSYINISDMSKVEAYAKLAGPAVESFGGQYLARGTADAVFEAGIQQRTVLTIFPSLDAAVSAYHSEAYGHALKALGDGAEREIRIIQALA